MLSALTRWLRLGFGRSYGPCGIPPRAWPLSAPLRVQLVRATVPSHLSVAALDYQLLLAVTAWRSACAVPLVHVPASSVISPLPEIMVRFAQMAQTPWDGPGGNLGYAHFPPTRGQPIAPRHGDIYLDPSEPWSPRQSHLGFSVSFYHVVLHELGHAIGLPHSPLKESVMYASYSTALAKPASTDCVAAQRLYPST